MRRTLAEWTESEGRDGDLSAYLLLCVAQGKKKGAKVGTGDTGAH